MKRLGVIFVCIAVVWACAAQPDSAAAEGRRLMPPFNLDCDRNELTSYTGEVVSYMRRDRRLSMIIHTDAKTVEPVTVELADDESWTDRLLINSGQFDGFERIEKKNGQLLKGTRATAWVCEDLAIGPVIDWQPGSAI